MLHKLFLGFKFVQIRPILAEQNLGGLHPNAVDGGQVHAGHAMQHFPHRFLAPSLDSLGFFFVLHRLQRDPVQLAKLRDPRCRKSEATMAKELTGNWREDHLFNLAQGLKMYDSLTERIGDYQREIERRIGKQSRPEAESTGSPGRPSSVPARG
jgi:hypothetical protein